MTESTWKDMEHLVRIVSAADGKIVGMTRLQKTAYLLELAGLGIGSDFRYRHFGPFSEELATAARLAPLVLDFHEEQVRSGWGGTYSVFTTNTAYDGAETDPFKQLVSLAKHADPIVLELAATAAWIVDDGDDVHCPWRETERRKPEKAARGRLKQARSLYKEFRGLRLPKALPEIRDGTQEAGEGGSRQAQTDQIPA